MNARCVRLDPWCFDVETDRLPSYNLATALQGGYRGATIERKKAT
jgi:hypothetical protein